MQSPNFTWFRDYVLRTTPDVVWGRALSPEDIEAIEQRNGIQFQPEHRQYLMQCHCASSPSNFTFKLTYDWDGIDSIESFQIEIRDGIEYDIEHNDLWVDSWGEKPENMPDRFDVFRKAFEGAPKMIPVHGHRYAFSAKDTDCPEVISIHQADMISYGRNLHDYLIREFVNTNQGATSRPKFRPAKKADAAPSSDILEIVAIGERWSKLGMEKKTDTIEDVPFWRDLL